MGVVSKPRIEDCCVKHPLFETPGFGHIMSHDHFIQILRSLVFFDVEDVNTDDPLYNIRKFTDHHLQTSLKYYEPDRYLTVDESMVKFTANS